MDVADKLIKEGKNVFISGFGGSSKTYYLSHNEFLKRDDVQFCGTTGLAAISLSNGENHPSTIHSFFGIGLGLGDKENVYKYAIRMKIKNGYIRKHKVITRILKCKTLVIDECSMLSSDLFEKIEYVARKIRTNWIIKDGYPIQLNTKYNDFYDETCNGDDIKYNEKSQDEDDDTYSDIKQRIFGGLQVILCGDLLQLPPIKAKHIFETNYFMKMKFKFVKFDIPYRHTDIDYYHLLNRIRDGTFTEDDVEILNSRIIDKKDIDKYKINNIRPTILYCTKKDTETYNENELDKLKDKEHIFIADDNDKKYKKYFDEAIPSEIKLKVGAQVMLRFNIDVSQGFINGSRGVILDINKDECLVQFKTGDCLVKRKKYWSFKDIETKKNIHRNQIPLILAYAMNIHKSQGLTIDSLVCDLHNAFVSGMIYVALSRCRTLNDLHLLSFDEEKITVSQNVIKFMKENELL